MISVIVTCYNNEAYIKECLDSIRTQTLLPMEIICVEDCSTDTTMAILRTYLERYPKSIRIIEHQTNQGIGVARNTGLQACRGDYVSFVDSDDFIHPNFLAELYKNIQTFNAEIAYSRTLNTVDANHASLAWLQTCLLPSASSHGLIHKSHMKIAAWSCLTKRSFWQNKIGQFPTLRYAEDTLPFLKRTVLATKTCFVSEAIYYYRDNSTSLTNTYHCLQREQCMIQVYHHCYEFLRQELAEQTKAAFCYYISNHPHLLNKPALSRFVADHPELTAADFKPWMDAIEHRRVFERYHPQIGYLQHKGIKRLLTLIRYGTVKQLKTWLQPQRFRSQTTVVDAESNQLN
jgi:glycosyltransferase involved in cell wall biosynthesis